MTQSTAKRRRVKVPGSHNGYLYVRENAQGEKVYEVGWRDADRRQHFKTVDGGITAARAERDRILGERARPGSKAPTNPRLTFREAADRYIDSLAQRDLRPNTIDGYRRTIERHLRERFNGRRLDQIDQESLDALIADLRSKGLSEYTIVKVLAVLSNVFQYAKARLGWSGDNPVRERERSDRPKPSKTAKPRRIFTTDELRATLDAAHEPYRTLFTLLADTGARISEVLGLRLVDLWLDDDDPRVRFAGQIDEDGAWVELKTEASKGTVPITEATAQVLREHLASEHAGEVYVFETRTGQPLDRHNVARALRSTLKRARVDGEPAFAQGERRPSLHSFRHNAASHLLNAGMTADDVARRLRHKDATVTRSVYVHEIRDAERRAVDRAVMESIF
jgi:integrase